MGGDSEKQEWGSGKRESKGGQANKGCIIEALLLACKPCGKPPQNGRLGCLLVSILRWAGIAPEVLALLPPNLRALEKDLRQRGGDAGAGGGPCHSVQEMPLQQQLRLEEGKEDGARATKKHSLGIYLVPGTVTCT